MNSEMRDKEAEARQMQEWSRDRMVPVTGGRNTDSDSGESPLPHGMEDCHF